MLKCPFCSFDNEEGALFCEQCKSDLSAVAATPAPAAPAAPEAVPMAAVLEETIPMAAPIEEVVQAVAEAKATPPMAAPAAEAVPPVAAPAAVAPPAASAEAAPPPAAPAAPPAPAAAPLPAGAQPKLVVIRGQKINIEYPIYEGQNFIGRSDEKPVDVDLDDQEPPDRVWASRQHALVNFENGNLSIEDLNSANGTYVNRQRVYPGQARPLAVNDIIQVGTVQLKVKA